MATRNSEKPKGKRQKRSCRRTLVYLTLGFFLCSGVLCAALVIIGPTLFAPEPIYVDPDFTLDVQPIDVTYRLPESSAYGGIFENGFYFQVDNHTVSVDIENGIAAVNHSLTITNTDSNVVDGVFIIPLPSEQTIDNVVVEINDMQADVTPYSMNDGQERLQSLASEYRDLSLLAYSNTPFVEVDVFPLLGTKNITVSYTHETEQINGLIALNIPLAFPVTVEHPVGQFSLTVNASDELPLRNIYPASLDLAITQTEETSFTGTTDLSSYTPPQNLELYYAPSDAEITTNVITYRESLDDDGYFVLLAEAAPIPENQVVARDILLVLDQSGSMSGVKWQQAQAAANFVLERLNPNDRFFVMTFSGSRAIFDNTLSSADTAQDAIGWVNNRDANGGTNINDALLETLRYVDPERSTTVLFMTDGQATEGVTDTSSILNNLQDAVTPNVRIFVFGVGDHVNTTLLDSIAREYGGETGYVRQNETIDEEISNLYAQISSPALTNLSIDFGEAVAGDFVPTRELSDLYAGQSMILVGRYRQGGDDITITLTGESSSGVETYTFDNLVFQEERGDRPFITQLWAARRVGNMLNTVRLGDNNSELTDSIVALSLRYGVITPYTQFLLEQSNVLSVSGREDANNQMALNLTNLQQNQTGATAVDSADLLNNLSSSRNYVATSSGSRFSGFSSSGSYYRQEIIRHTPTPLPDIYWSGVLITFEQQASETNNEVIVMQYVMSLDEEAFERAMFRLQDTVDVTSPMDLPVLIGDLVNTYGIERGISIYNAVFGAYLPIVAVDEALIEGNYEVTALPYITPQPLRAIAEKVFILQDGVYLDTTYDPEMTVTETIIFGSNEYDLLIVNQPELLPYLSVGLPLIIRWDDTVFEFRYE